MSSVDVGREATLPGLMDLVEFVETTEVYGGRIWQVEWVHGPTGTVDEATLADLFPDAGPVWVRVDWPRSGFVCFRRVVGEATMEFVGPVPAADDPVFPGGG